MQVAGSKLRIVFGLLALTILLSSCATQPPPEISEPPGILLGLLHGFIIIFSLVASFFTDVRIYAYPNAGIWYDLGFVIGAMSALGAGGAGATKKRRRRED